MKIEDNGKVKVNCRICREEWLLPPKLAEQFNSEHGYECPYCIFRLERKGERL